MAKFTKAQQKRAAIAMKQKAFKLLMHDAISTSDYERIVKIKQKVMRKLGYPHDSR